jgi:hypothetical protein
MPLRAADERYPSDAISTIEPTRTAAASRPTAQHPIAPNGNENYWRPSVKLDRIAVNDIVEVRVRGSLILGRVTEINDGVVYFNPICPAPAGGTPKRATSSPTGARQEDSGPAREDPNSKPTATIDEQLSLAEGPR